MTRVLLAAVLLAAAPPDSRADEAAVRFTVRPMPAPKPVLRYQLLPEWAELSPGNAAQGYLLCFMEQRTFFFGKEAVAERARYLAMPLAELPADRLREYGGAALRQADWAARLDTVDWQYLSGQPRRWHWETFPGSWGSSRSWRRRCKSGSAPRWPSADSTTRSAPPRRCSPCLGTWANTARRSRISSGCGSRTWPSAAWKRWCNSPAAPTSTGR